MRVPFVPFPFLFLLIACNPFGNDEDDRDYDPPCTLEFVSVQFWVVDATGVAQEGFQLTITNTRSGESYNVEQRFEDAGLYIVLDDRFRNDVYGDGDSIHVEGNDGVRTFDTDFVIGASRCHIHKVSGPDSVVVN